MREKHIPQMSIFNFYCEHETGQQLKSISAQLDSCPKILELAADALIDPAIKATGRNGLSVDSIVRATLLKQMMGLSYDELSFYLSDSLSYRTFARTNMGVNQSLVTRGCIT